MSRIRNANRGTFKRFKKKQGALAVQTPLSSTAVERGSTRWLAGSNVQIDGILAVAGTFNVSGTTTISGALTIAGPTGITGSLTIQGITDITGQLNVTGPTALDGITTIGGDTTITGLLAVEGNSTISGTLDITGRTTIAADLELLTGGKLIAGQTTIEPNGKATFGDVTIDPNSIYMIQAPGGNMVSGATDQISLSSSSTSSVSLDGSRAELNYGGGASPTRVVAREGAIDLSAAKVHVSAALDAPAMELLGTKVRIKDPYVTTNAANVYMDANGWIYRVQ